MTEPYRCPVCGSDDPAVRKMVTERDIDGVRIGNPKRCTHPSHDLTGPTPERMSNSDRELYAEEHDTITRALRGEE